MKRLIGYVLALALVVGGCPGLAKTTHADGFQISFSFFHHRLSPHGRWAYVPRYGQVWYPIGLDPYWQPYTNGYWAYTDFGWTWVSYDDFGWITFHYGAWTWFSPYGWVWVPGYVWGPAWVTWRYGPRYIGWAPLPPDYGFYYGSYCPPVRVIERAWVFVPADDIGRYNIGAIRVPAYRNVEFFQSTREITNITVVKDHVVNSGPDDTGSERVRKVKVRQGNVEQFGIKPQPLNDLPASREITITKPYKSRTVTDSGDDVKGDRPIDRERFDDSDATPKPGRPTGDRPFDDRYFDNKGATPKPEKPSRDDRPFDDGKAGDRGYTPKPEKPSREDRPYDDGRPGDKGYAPKPEKPSRSGGEDKGDYNRPYPQDKYPDRTSPYPTRPKSQSDARSSAWFDARSESRRAPIQKPIDPPKAWPDTQYDAPAYRKTPSPSYEAPSQRYPSRSDSAKPNPPRREKSSGDSSVYRDRGDSSTKTPRYVYRSETKSAPAKPTSPMGSSGSRAGGSAKKGKP